MKILRIIKLVFVITLTPLSSWASDSSCDEGEELNISFLWKQNLEEIHMSDLVAEIYDCSKIFPPDDLQEISEDIPYDLLQQPYDLFQEEMKRHNPKIVNFATEIPPTIEVIEAIAALASQDRIIVIAAGNNRKTLGKDGFGQHLIDLVTRKDVNGRIILVGALEEGEDRLQIHKMSNRAGGAQEHFITAFVDPTLPPLHEVKEQRIGIKLEGTYSAACLVTDVIEDFFIGFPYRESQDIIKALYDGAAKSVIEQPNGYLVAKDKSVEADVERINRERLKEYQRIADEKNVPLSAVEAMAAEEIRKKR